MATEMNLIKRMKGETPKFFKRIITIGVSLFGIGSAILVAQQSGVTFPEGVLYAAQQCIWIGSIATIISKLTLEQPKDNTNA
jgi:hypothetical protein